MQKKLFPKTRKFLINICFNNRWKHLKNLLLYLYYKVENYYQFELYKIIKYAIRILLHVVIKRLPRKKTSTKNLNKF